MVGLKNIRLIQSISSELFAINVPTVNVEQFTNLKLSRGFPLAIAHYILAPTYFDKDLLCFGTAAPLILRSWNPNRYCKQSIIKFC